MRTRMWGLVGMLAIAASPALAAPGVGDKTPKIGAGGWLNLPEGLKSLTMDELKGRVVMVEFWATW